MSGLRTTAVCGLRFRVCLWENFIGRDSSNFRSGSRYDLRRIYETVYRDEPITAVFGRRRRGDGGGALALPLGKLGATLVEEKGAKSFRRPSGMRGSFGKEGGGTLAICVFRRDGNGGDLSARRVVRRLGDGRVVRVVAREILDRGDGRGRRDGAFGRRGRDKRRKKREEIADCGRFGYAWDWL